jgi:HD-GYP domain-containing protein (c-di-GMP phosphodiesterase class II)
VETSPGLSSVALPSPAIRRAAQALRDAFGVRFAFRIPAEPWSAVPLDDSLEQAGPLPPRAAAELSSWLEDKVSVGTFSIDGGEGTLLAIRLPPSLGLVATTVVADTDAGALKRVAALVLDNLALTEQLKIYQAELDGCLAQIGEDFEELTFLRKLCEYLDMVHLHSGPLQVAELVLTELAPLVNAQALALLLARQGDNGSAGAGRQAVWIGEELLSNALCHLLIQEHNATSAHRPVVNNRVAEIRGAERFPAIRELIIVPLLKRGCVLGWLLALNRVPSPDVRNELAQREFGSVQATLISSVASMLATHTHNVELFRQRENLLVSVVRSMVSAIDAKDHYTRGHSERVALVARALAERLTLSDEECDRIYLAGLLHDIGKIGISDAVLHKPDHLTPAEFDQIKGHPDQGWAILKDLDQLAHILPGVLHHHERYDGRGYPDGLAGQEIPLTARILAVADAYDAMCSDRPYRRGMPLTRVEEILRSGSGTHWDPVIIGALIGSMREIGSVWREYQEPAMPQRCTPAPVAPIDIADSRSVVDH